MLHLKRSLEKPRASHRRTNRVDGWAISASRDSKPGGAILKGMGSPGLIQVKPTSRGSLAPPFIFTRPIG
jgi:hypothetical protein